MPSPCWGLRSPSPLRSCRSAVSGTVSPIMPFQRGQLFLNGKGLSKFFLWAGCLLAHTKAQPHEEELYFNTHPPLGYLPPKIIIKKTHLSPCSYGDINSSQDTDSCLPVSHFLKGWGKACNWGWLGDNGNIIQELQHRTPPSPWQRRYEMLTRVHCVSHAAGATPGDLKLFSSPLHCYNLCIPLR